MTDNERQLAALLDYLDDLKEYIGVLEEERDNYEMLLKHLCAYDDNVQVHKFEDVVDRVQEHIVNCETVDVSKVTKDSISFQFNFSNGTSRTVSVPLPTSLVV